VSGIVPDRQRTLPDLDLPAVGDLTDHATELLVQALCPESYIEIVEEALEQMRHPILACEENSSVLVNTILRLIEKRRGESIPPLIWSMRLN
jgi:hypothetical protein